MKDFIRKVLSRENLEDLAGAVIIVSVWIFFMML